MGFSCRPLDATRTQIIQSLNQLLGRNGAGTWKQWVSTPPVLSTFLSKNRRLQVMYAQAFLRETEQTIIR